MVTRELTFGKTVDNSPYGVLTLSEIDVNAAANTSTLRVTLTLKRPQAVTDNGTKTASVTIDGTSYTWSGSMKGSGNLTLISENIIVPHETNGSKTIIYNAQIVLNMRWGTKQLSTITLGQGALPLTYIRRTTQIGQTELSKTETSVTIMWTASDIVDRLYYSTDNGTNWTQIAAANASNGQYTITGLTANTQYQVKTRVRNKSTQQTQTSDALTVKTYNYPYCLTAPDFDLGDDVQITLYNPLNRSVLVEVIGADNSILDSQTVQGSVYTLVSGNSTISTRIIASVTNAHTANYSVDVTYDTHQATTSGGTYTIIPSSATMPTCAGITYQDTNPVTTAITGDNQKIVQNLSTVKFTVTGLAAKGGATIDRCDLLLNGVAHAMTISGTTATTLLHIDSAANVRADVHIRDSRGIFSSLFVYAETVTMLEYHTPTAQIKVNRQDNFYTDTYIKVSADYSSIDGNNTVTISLRGVREGASSPEIFEMLTNNVQATVQADNADNWNLYIRVTDGFNEYVDYMIFLPRGIPIIFFDRKKLSVGINCFPFGTKTLEVNGVAVKPGYSTGDEEKLDDMVISGYATDAKTMVFTVMLPKSMANVTPSLTSVKGRIQSLTGAVESSTATTDWSNYTVALTKKTDNLLKIQISNSTAFANLTSGDMLVWYANGLKVTF